jgi:hypothetical protein
MKPDPATSIDAAWLEIIEKTALPKMVDREGAASILSELIGRAVAADTLRRWPVPYNRLGRHVRYRIDELDAFAKRWLAAQPMRKADYLRSRSVVDSDTGCWNWTRGTAAAGYGLAHFERKLYAHRLAYETFIGPIPDGLSVCHHCDNPGCVNPDHLFAGSQADNLADMIGKGRQIIPRGEAKKNSKLTESAVAAIRAAPRRRGALDELAARYGVTKPVIWAVRARRTWRHCP